jgi:hypothetical protein
MKCPAAFVTALAMTACTPTQAPRPDTASLAAQEAPAYSGEALATPVQVDITALNGENVVCRRAAPTGTRIAVTQCESTVTLTDAQNHEQMLRDLDEMRRRQWQQEAVRQNAMREVLTGRPGAIAPAPQP